jgi:hypothetical protein
LWPNICHFRGFWPLKLWRRTNSISIFAHSSHPTSTHIHPANVRAYQLVSLSKRTLCTGKNHRFCLPFLPTHRHVIWPVTIKYEPKSGQQISSRDFVSLLPLCCAFGIPEVFIFAVSPAGPQIFHLADFLPRVGITTTQPSITQHESTSTGKLISSILIIRTSISFTRQNAGSPASHYY